MRRFFGRSKDRDRDEPAVRVLLVCMGNICRSPMAEGLLRQRLSGRSLPLPVDVDSAGTHGYHEGAAPDSRAQETTLRRGVDISSLRARRVRDQDFERFDLVIAMDEDNRSALLEQAPAAHHGKIRLLLDYAGEASNRNVPDPYYGGMLGFERVLDLVEEAMAGLVG
ncbi:MAG: low molecular weight phosphotyrosine protein phosphatase [Gammaproteobacteria bacterium]|nr:low molecular weight phosphotyrosine protein phosphatase [Gammaproteobacteria bacterium]